MAGYWATRILEYAEMVQNEAQRVYNEVEEDVWREADEHALRVIIPTARYGIQEAYNDAVTAWYEAYSPSLYSRKHSLYKALQLTDPGGGSVGWDISEDLQKPSWSGKKTHNLYTYVFSHGSHGGPIYGGGKTLVRMPVRTTPIPEMFDNQIGDLTNYLQGQLDTISKQYFDDNIQYRFDQRFVVPEFIP